MPELQQWNMHPGRFWDTSERGAVVASPRTFPEAKERSGFSVLCSENSLDLGLRGIVVKEFDLPRHPFDRAFLGRWLIQ